MILHDKRISAAAAVFGALVLTTSGAAAQSFNCDPLYQTCEDLVGTVSTLSIASELSAFRQFRPSLRFGRLNGPDIAGQDTLAPEDAATARRYSTFASIGGQKLSGDFDGSSAKLMFGADMSVGADTTIGLTLSTGRNSTTPNGTLQINRTETLIGPYFGTKLTENLSLDGFIAFGNPAYEVAGVTFDSSKTIGGITLSGLVETTRAEMTPFVSLSGSRENVPAYTAGGTNFPAAENRTTILTLGSQVYYSPIDRPKALIQPFAGFEVDFAKVTNSLGPDSSYRAARLSGGALFAFDTGYLEVKGEFAKSSDNYDTAGLSLFYGMQF